MVQCPEPDSVYRTISSIATHSLPLATTVQGCRGLQCSVGLSSHISIFALPILQWEGAS